MGEGTGHPAVAGQGRMGGASDSAKHVDRETEKQNHVKKAGKPSLIWGRWDFWLSPQQRDLWHRHGLGVRHSCAGTPRWCARGVGWAW